MANKTEINPNIANYFHFSKQIKNNRDMKS